MIHIETCRSYWSNTLVISIINLSPEYKEIALKEVKKHFGKHFSEECVKCDHEPTILDKKCIRTYESNTNIVILIPELREQYIDLRRYLKIMTMVGRLAQHIRIRHHKFKRVSIDANGGM